MTNRYLLGGTQTPTVSGSQATVEVATTAALQALAKPTDEIAILLLGDAAAGDGGGGWYWWSAASSATDTSATTRDVIAPTAGGTGRWLLLAHNAISQVNTIALLRAVTVAGLYDDQRMTVLGYYAAGDGGGGTFYWSAASSASDNGGTVILPTGQSAGTPGRWVRVVEDGVVTSKQFGAKADNATDAGAAFNAMSTAAIAGGYKQKIDPGTYLLSTQWTVSGTPFVNTEIEGFGAEIYTSGAISGFRNTINQTPHLTIVRGLTINHRGNADATAGFEVVGCPHTHFIDCTVEAHGVSASYAAYLVRNSTPSDANTGSYWTRFVRCYCRKRSGSDSGNITYGIRLQGAANATSIEDCGLNNVTTGLHVTVESGQTYLANGWLVSGTAFEGYTTAVHVEGAATSNISGHRFIGNRFESGTTVFSYTGTTSQPSMPPFMAGNHLVSNAGTYLNNPNGLYYSSLDLSITPTPSGYPRLYNNGPIILESGLNTSPTVNMRFPSTGQGLQFSLSDDTLLGKIRYAASGKLQIEGNGSSIDVYPMDVGGISGTSTRAENLRGAATFSSAATKAVTFATAEADSSYYVAISGNANETFWVTSRTASGFTLNSSNATSTATVLWILVR